MANGRNQDQEATITLVVIKTERSTHKKQVNMQISKQTLQLEQEKVRVGRVVRGSAYILFCPLMSDTTTCTEHHMELGHCKI